MSYHITAYSTALYSTWIAVEPLGILFDAGDGLSAGLLGKAGKIKHVFISHPDRDHLTGLLQFLQLNARPGAPKIYYPEDAGSFPHLATFQQKFDPHVAAVPWQGIQDGAEISLGKNLLVQAIRNNHVPAAPGVSKSLSFKVFETKRKVKPEFARLSQAEMKEIASTRGREFLTKEVRTNVLSYSGDTPVDDYARWDGSEILIHEATFLHAEKDTVPEGHRNKHSLLDDVFRMVREINIGRLILSHFSSRYTRGEIDQAIRHLCKVYNIEIPVYAIYPGEIHRDILNE
ncbi:MAG: MBL fold metallo-hydrolase, partial [Bacteroidota bacterium]